MEKYVPDMYQGSIYTINYKKLKKQGIKCLLFDLNNTLASYETEAPTDELRELMFELEKDFKVIIVSNSPKNRVRPFKEKLKSPEDLKLNFKYQIQRRDIDTNGHVNNLNYIDFALESLAENIFNNTTFNNLTIEYKKEIKPNEIINCYYSFENNQHIVIIKSENSSITHSIIKLH